MHGIVVGVSASAAGVAAMQWALRQAALRQVPLVAVRAWDIPSYGPYYSVGSALCSTSPDVELTDLEIAREALAQAAQAGPGRRRCRGDGCGDARPSARGHATGPGAVIPETPQRPVPERAPVVVGVDRSQASLRALAWAVSQVRQSGATLAPLSVRGGGGGAADEDELACVRAAAEAAGSAAEPTVPVEPQLRRGNVSHELLAAAEDADLLVIGSRGRGGFASLLLGSTSSQVAGHATRPVVVVRPE